MIVRFRAIFPLTLLLAVLTVSVGCGVDFNSPVPVKGDPRNLVGTWSGSIQDTQGGGGVTGITITFDGSGQISDITATGSYIGDNGSVEGVDGDTRLFLITLDLSGTPVEAGLYTDSTYAHGGFLDQDFNVAVVEKDADVPLPYELGDLDTNGDKSTRFINIDESFTITPGGTSSITVDTTISPHLIGNDSEIGAFEIDTLTLEDGTLGLYTGILANTDGGSITNGVFAALLSPDKNFAGSYACNTPTIEFGNCGFRIWSY